MAIYNPDCLDKTTLYLQLIKMRDNPEIPQSVRREINQSISLVDKISGEAAQIMKTAYTNFPEYTLHDETHLLSVVNIMGRILNESESLNNLSYIEITILLLSAYLHDIGMAPSSDKLDEIIKSPEFSLYQENELINHEGFKEIVKILGNDTLTDNEKEQYEYKINEIKRSVLTEYLRINHGTVGFDYIIKKWSDDPRWIIDGSNISSIVAWVCKGHTIDANQIEFDFSKQFTLDKLIGQNRINIRYCTVILRLADILDFDRKRTPKILYENISPKNEISLKEWNKHISISGWSISKERIIFEAECIHPVYEKALRTFLDYIDRELQECKNIVNNFPERDDIAKKYRLSLPNSVDRSKIVAKDGAYNYIDLAFSLSHEEIMKLLMGTEFWGGTSLCIRELIQNAYDSIRYRHAVEELQEIDWCDGKITLIQRLNEDGCLELECIDNGMGMDLNILQNYFFNVGKSYYRSPKFEQIRNGLKQKNVDFDPVSQFGIGIISSFMVGDSLKIETQKYNGPYFGCDDFIKVDVDGISRLVIVRKINVANPKSGTKITIIGKKIPENEASDPMLDPLCLLDSTQYYAAALNIPIEVIVESPFNEYKGIIPAPLRPLKLKTEFELDNRIPSENYVTLELNLNSMNPNYEGTARISFLIDSSGKINTQNEWGKFVLDDRYHKDDLQKFYNLIRISDNEKINEGHFCRSVLAQDGILVCDNDCKRDSILSYRGYRYPSPNYQFFGSYFINISGNAKLPLKPNRAPYIHDFSLRSKESRIWYNFESKLDFFISSVVCNIIEDEILNPEPQVLWDIIEINNFSLNGLDSNWAYSNVPLPFSSTNESIRIEWNTLKELQSRGIRYFTIGYASPLKDDISNIPLEDLHLNYCSDKTISNEVIKIIIANSTLSLKNKTIYYKINSENRENKKLLDFQFIESSFSRRNMQEYSNELMDFLSINNPAKSVNLNHPVIQFILNDWKKDKNSKEWFRFAILNIADLAQDRDFDEKEPIFWEKDTIHKVNNVISHLKKVDWNEISESLKPPYKIFYPVSGNVYGITLDYLEKKLSDSRLTIEKEKPKKIDLS